MADQAFLIWVGPDQVRDSVEYIQDGVDAKGTPIWRAQPIAGETYIGYETGDIVRELPEGFVLTPREQNTRHFAVVTLKNYNATELNQDLEIDFDDDEGTKQAPVRRRKNSRGFNQADLNTTLPAAARQSKAKPLKGKDEKRNAGDRNDGWGRPPSLSQPDR